MPHCDVLLVAVPRRGLGRPRRRVPSGVHWCLWYALHVLTVKTGQLNLSPGGIRNRTSVIANRRCDQLKMLEVYASSKLPPPSELVKTRPIDLPTAHSGVAVHLVHKPDSSLSVFDFCAIWQEPGRSNGYIERAPIGWLYSLECPWSTGAGELWYPRLERLIGKMEADKDVILAVGCFRWGRDSLALVCATMRYHHIGPFAGWYLTENSFCCVCPDTQ